MLLASEPALATPIQWVISSSESQLTYDDTGIPWPQAPGSEVTDVSGTIDGNVGSGKIEISSAAAVLLNSGNWLPDSSLGMSPEPANFGLLLLPLVPPGDQLYWAVRNLTYKATLAPQTLIPTGPGAWQFSFSDPSVWHVTAGTISYKGFGIRAGETHAESLIDGSPDGNFNGLPGSLTDIPGGTKLVLPVAIQVNDADFSLHGTIVAYAIPEPSTSLLAAVGWIGLAFAALCRSRRPVSGGRKRNASPFSIGAES